MMVRELLHGHCVLLSLGEWVSRSISFSVILQLLTRCILRKLMSCELQYADVISRSLLRK